MGVCIEANADQIDALRRECRITFYIYHLVKCSLEFHLPFVKMLEFLIDCGCMQVAA
jgi:hypothetical protein